MNRLRTPALAPPPVVPGLAVADDPTRLVEARYRRVFETSMHDLPFINPALRVEAAGFIRLQGDWVGALVTPWWVGLILVPGGGSLWRDLSSGERQAVPLPAGGVPFIADADDREADLPVLQYCPLFAPPSSLPDQSTALAAAKDALAAALQPPPETAGPPPTSAVATAATATSDPARRGFLRRMTGR